MNISIQKCDHSSAEYIYGRQIKMDSCNDISFHKFFCWKSLQLPHCYWPLRPVTALFLKSNLVLLYHPLCCFCMYHCYLKTNIKCVHMEVVGGGILSFMTLYCRVTILKMADEICKSLTAFLFVFVFLQTKKTHQENISFKD